MIFESFGKRLLSGMAVLLLVIPRIGEPKEPASATSRPLLKLTPCRLEQPGRQSVEGRCGNLEVAENPAAPQGRKIGLRVAVVPALNRNGARDPLFVLSGGPGQAASEFYVPLAGAFARVQRDRDIVLVDQRGTGASNALRCDFPDEDAAMRLAARQIQALTRSCLASLRGNPLYYTTSIAVHDLDAARVALGYGRINLYGISYGTRVAQHYLRRYPGNVRTLILDGVVSPQRILGVDSALEAQRAVDSIFERCRADAACRKAFSAPARDLEELRKRLAQAAVQVSFPDPIAGTVTQSPVRLDDLQLVVRLTSYASEQAALLPLLLDQGVRGNLAPLAAQSRMLARHINDVISIGMHNAVICTEDAPFFESAEPDRQALKKSYLGAAQLDMLEQICSAWPRGTMDADLHAPLDSRTPALLLSGSADPVTPPAYAKEALKGLHAGLHVVLEGQGHGQLARGCVPTLMARFLERGDSVGLDVACARETAPAPFFITFSGPSP